MSKPTVSSSSTSTLEPARKLSIFQTVQRILATDGPLGFMRGLGPALVLVINPVIQYTVFEQLKNALVTRRVAASHAAGGAAVAAAVLTDLDFFLLGALSKFSETILERDGELWLNTHSCNWINVSIYVRHVEGGRVRVLTVIISVVKSRLQAGHAKYKSAFDGILSIIKNEGIGGVYKGVGNKLLQSVLMAAVLFVGQKKIYEVIKKVGILFHSCRSVWLTLFKHQALTTASLKKIKKAV